MGVQKGSFLTVCVHFGNQLLKQWSGKCFEVSGWKEISFSNPVNIQTHSLFEMHLHIWNAASAVFCKRNPSPWELMKTFHWSEGTTVSEQRKGGNLSCVVWTHQPWKWGVASSNQNGQFNQISKFLWPLSFLLRNISLYEGHQLQKAINYIPFKNSLIWKVLLYKNSLWQ